jgi:integrase
MLQVGGGQLDTANVSSAVDQGQSAKYVQTVMGHASAQTTLDVYGHLFDTGGQDAARSLERWLAQTERRNRDAAG